MAWNNNEPFGAPRGTVRGAIALLMVVGTIIVYAVTGEAPIFLSSATATIIAFYFISKAIGELKK